MDFNLSNVQQAWRSKAHAIADELPSQATAADIVSAAARTGLLDSQADLLAAALAIERLAFGSAAAGIALALHTAVMLGLAGDGRFTALARGEVVGAIALSSDEVPALDDGRLTGRASWAAPLTGDGVAVVGARNANGLQACAVSLGAGRIRVEPLTTAALSGLVAGHLAFEHAECTTLGATVPFMSRARVLLAAAGLGMGKRALREALEAAHGRTGHGAGGEQTVQGLLADAATELDAATMLTWKAASAPALSLADASMAKLAATEATQRAVARATQVIGADSFRDGHVIERLAQDVRALELFAGRTEALREAVADEVLPRA